MQPLLIIVSGPPCAGKTVLGAWLAQHLRLPLFHRDSFKEVLFDSLGWSDLEWSQRLGSASYHLLYHTLETLLKAQNSVIIESNFDPSYDTERLAQLQQQYRFVCLQVRCMADGPILFERFKRRVQSGERHPGHIDEQNIPIYQSIVTEDAGARNDFLDLPSERIDINTNDFDAIDYVNLQTQINAAITRLRRPTE
jgi:predicted kinase